MVKKTEISASVQHLTTEIVFLLDEVVKLEKKLAEADKRIVVLETQAATQESENIGMFEISKLLVARSTQHSAAIASLVEFINNLNIKLGVMEGPIDKPTLH